MIKSRCFPDKNYKSVYFNGKTIRIAIDSSKSIKELRYPEFYDIKITEKCDGACPYCYQNSTIEDDHYKDCVQKLDKFFSSLTNNQKPFQIACLEESTPVITPNGMKEISKLKIGDKVLNENGMPVKVVGITTSEKECIELKGDRGFSVICTQDHIFIDENAKQIQAKDLKNVRLKLNNNIFEKSVEKIDMAKWTNPSSRIPGVVGGSSGGIITDNKVALMHTMSMANRYVELDEEVMWLYGIIVAEGSRKGLGFHRNEVEYQDKAERIYKKITGVDKPCRRYYHNNSCNFEFFETKYYTSLFMKEMQIEGGSSKVSIKYLFGLPKNLIKFALRGMFDGDGCYRQVIDQRTNRANFSASYKTASKSLANELRFLLKAVFNIDAALHVGTNSNRSIEGRNLPKTVYYKIDIYGIKNVSILFDDLFAKKYSLYSLQKPNKFSYPIYKKGIKIKDIFKAGVRKVVDIKLENISSHLFIINHNVVTHNCGGGEPTMSPYFTQIMELTRSYGIAPNYTTNGTFVKKFIKDKILDTTEKYCEGVAVTCHEHLDHIWPDATEEFLNRGIFTNFHILISDKKSIRKFIDIYHIYRKRIKYFVLLPLIAQGRCNNAIIDDQYFFNEIDFLKEMYGDVNDIAYGANFYPYLLKHNRVDVDLYEPEIMSKYIDLKDMKFYKSSFNLEEVDMEKL